MAPKKTTVAASTTEGQDGNPTALYSEVEAKVPYKKKSESKKSRHHKDSSPERLSDSEDADTWTPKSSKYADHSDKEKGRNSRKDARKKDHGRRWNYDKDIKHIDQPASTPLNLTNEHRDSGRRRREDWHDLPDRSSKYNDRPVSRHSGREDRRGYHHEMSSKYYENRERSGLSRRNVNEWSSKYNDLSGSLNSGREDRRGSYHERSSKYYENRERNVLSRRNVDEDYESRRRVREEDRPKWDHQKGRWREDRHDSPDRISKYNDRSESHNSGREDRRGYHHERTSKYYESRERNVLSRRNVNEDYDSRRRVREEDRLSHQENARKSYYMGPPREPYQRRQNNGSKFSEKERAARQKEMQMDAELHEEQRWKRLKKADEVDAEAVQYGRAYSLTGSVPPGTHASVIEGMEYRKDSKMHNGAFGSVYKAFDTTGQEVVIKEILYKNVDDGVPRTALRESSSVRRLRLSPHVVRLLDVKHSMNDYGKDVLWLVYKYYKNGDMREFLSSNSLHPDKVKKFMFDLLEGLLHCHSYGIIHRDLKTANILVDDDENGIAITDFGLARAYIMQELVYTKKVVTRNYKAPEILLGSGYQSRALDIWSLGCIFAELASNKILFAGMSKPDIFVSIVSELGEPTEDDWPGVTKLPNWGKCTQKLSSHLKKMGVEKSSQLERIGLEKLLPELDIAGVDLLKRMLRLNPAKRISCEEAMADPYFHSLGRTPQPLPVPMFKQGDLVQLGMGALEDSFLGRWENQVSKIVSFTYNDKVFDQQPLHRAVQLLVAFTLSPLFEHEKFEQALWCCFHLACKFEVVKYSDTLDDYTAHTESPVSSTSVEEMVVTEAKILKALDYNVGDQSLWNLLELLRAASVSEDPEDAHCKKYLSFLADLSLLDLRLLARFPFSLIASSIMFLARFFSRDVIQPWSAELSTYTGYSSRTMKSCIGALSRLVRSQLDMHFDAVVVHHGIDDLDRISSLDVPDDLFL